MKKSVKNVLYNVYLKTEKGQKIIESGKPSVEIYVKNQNIVIRITKEKNFGYTLIFNEKKYPFKDKKYVTIPFEADNMKMLSEQGFKVVSEGYRQSTTYDSSELEVKFTKAKIKVQSIDYVLNDEVYALLNIERQDDSLVVNTKIMSAEPIDLTDSRFVLLNKNFNVYFESPLKDQVVVDNASELLDGRNLQVVVLTSNGFVKPVIRKFEDDVYRVKKKLERTYLCKINNNYECKGDKLVKTVADMKPWYKAVDAVSYESSSHQLVVKMKEDKFTNKTFKLYLCSLKYNSRELVGEYPMDSQIIIENLDEMLDREINAIDRYTLEYEVTNAKGKVLDTNWLKIVKPKTKNIEEYILYKAHGNQLSFLNKHFLIIENQENHFTYEKVYDFDLEANTFSTDCDVKLNEEGQVVLDFTIFSLLSRIKKYTIFLVDSYEKKNYFLCEKKLDAADRVVKDSVIVDMDKISEHLYYNARLNIKIAVQYAGGFKEVGFLNKKRGKYSTADRYLLKLSQDEGLVTSFYLGANIYNLNIWHTSEDEYEKGVSFQMGREKYFDTLHNEPVDEKLVMFEANLGKNYTGNPKYLYEYMINSPEYADYKFVWAYPDVDSDAIPGNPILAKRGSEEYFYYLAKAKYWVNNILYPVKEKRNETVYLQTWHGTPLKKLGFDIECEGPEKQAFGNLYKESQNWDYLLVDNDYGEEKLVGAFRFKKQVIKAGYPINDIFYDEKLKSKATDRLSSQYPMINGKKVVLYAPTWRDLQGDYVRGYDFELPFDVDKLYEKIGDEYVVLVKLHHLVADSLEIDDKYKDFLVNVSGEEDVMELLCITDVLITDYSSVFYDFASAKKPILFYAYDLEEYINETRGLYVSMDTMPGPIIKNSEELVDAFENIDKYTYDNSEKLRDFCNDMAKYCDGNARAKVLDIVIKGEKND